MEAVKTVEEAYIQAENAKNLRVDPERKRLVDVLIAAGMTPGILGHALMRLQSEYDGAAKQLHAITETEARLLFNSLKSMPDVLEAVAAWTARRGHERPHELVGEVVAFGLDDNCRHCKGRGYSMIRGRANLCERTWLAACSEVMAIRWTSAPKISKSPGSDKLRGVFHFIGQSS